MTPISLTFLPMDQDPLAVDTNPDSVAKWLESLTFGKSAESAETIADILQKTNRVNLDIATRQRLMEYYLAAFERVLSPLKQELERPEVLSTRHGRLAINAVESLLGGLFTGFRLCLVAKLNKRAIRTRLNAFLTDNEHSKVALASTALMCARQLINWSAQYHTPVPKGVWLYCHELYSLICQLGWQDKLSAEKVSFASMYRQMLLLAMLPSERLNFATFEWMRNIVLARESWLTFGAAEDNLQKKGAFYFEASVDSPPCFLRIPPKNLSNWQVINADVIKQELQHLLLSMERHGTQQPIVEVEWLRVLLMEWSQPARRSHIDVDNQKICIQTQLKNICHLLRNKNWNESTASAEDSTEFAAKPLFIQQVSSNAKDLKCQGETQDQIIRVGELVLCKEEQGSDAVDEFDSVYLALIRGFSIKDRGQTVEFIAERIGSKVSSVELVPVVEEGDDDNVSISALLLPPRLRLGRGPLLVLPGRIFSRMKEFRMKDANGDEHFIRLMNLTSQTELYQLVGFLNSADM